MLVDATLREEQAREGEMVVTMNKDGELCQIAKLGGASVGALTILECTSLALLKVQEISQLIAAKLRHDAASRDIGGLIAELSAQNDR